MAVAITPFLIDRIRKKAKKSDCNYKVAALGFNAAGECVCARSNVHRFNGYGRGWHAEELVMREAKRKGIVRILICRVGWGEEDHFHPIDPCKKCRKLAEKLGIKIETIKEEI